ncbi:MAG: DUF2155 domain-containing protein [Magnetococcales bacterium]|nr:DUF2155 domain-containing protein [Magnetococcales bacterium]
MATVPNKRIRHWWPWLILMLVAGIAVGYYQQMPTPRSQAKFVPVNTRDTNKTPRLPLAPHIHEMHARPDAIMTHASAGKPMRFRLLDKRTMRIDQLSISVGEIHAAPWGGWIAPLAYAPDLVVRDGEAAHGREGHVNPAVWVELRNQEKKKFHEGWMFARDSAQTAWDHPRFDLTFLGPEEIPVKTR